MRLRSARTPSASSDLSGTATGPRSRRRPRPHLASAASRAGHELRLGVFGLTPPAGTDPNQALEWAISEASTMNVDLMGGDPRTTFRWGQFKCDPGYWRELGARAQEAGFEIEPFVRSPFDVAGQGGGQGRDAGGGKNQGGQGARGRRQRHPHGQPHG